ncbi:hypothetical protein [Janthinobacterium sp. B9-8]|uniref:hypothetical protein n=1 Tax=Janthinobacterium sp. B9-8 TaxID=1236179 RepID=UPI00061D14FF|nr:hypothetical protein [Janthinobacterium sp. B9-8]AMC34772.1 hypothetical protein VN23_09190 [Janthinobacterium sp. B9-8]
MTAKIMYASPEAASIQTVTGWVSSRGRFFAHDEHMARYDGSTHKLCECGAEVDQKSYCSPCALKKLQARFDAMPYQAWNGKDWLYSHSADRYFDNPSQIIEYCEEEEVSVFDLQLVFCISNLPEQINLTEIWRDDMPEDGDESHIPAPILNALAVLNKAIKENAEPLSYSPTDFSVSEKSLIEHFGAPQ